MPKIPTPKSISKAPKYGKVPNISSTALRKHRLEAEKRIGKKATDMIKRVMKREK